MVTLMEGDASSSVGVALVLLASLFRELVKSSPALRFSAFKEPLEGGVLKALIRVGGDFRSGGGIGSEFCIQWLAY
jgi:hypothetical protein